MDREQLLSTILTADPQPGELVYVERRGDSYAWRSAHDGEWHTPADHADAWIYYSWQRALADRESAGRMLDDLLAEMEAMTGAATDRCRWPLNEPWPHGH
ncbi:MAG: hypothetical protein JWR37_2822 [Mycobacterium sp.]|nr:hypothetical protein [Mycobacterium sp.]